MYMYVYVDVYVVLCYIYHIYMYIYVYIYMRVCCYGSILWMLVLIRRDNSLSTLSYCSFVYKQRVLKAFSSDK